MRVVEEKSLSAASGAIMPKSVPSFPFYCHKETKIRFQIFFPPFLVDLTSISVTRFGEIFGENLKIFGNTFKVDLGLAKFLTHFGIICMLWVKFSLL